MEAPVVGEVVAVSTAVVELVLTWPESVEELEKTWRGTRGDPTLGRLRRHL